jgi:tetratricopeptide (TPR) repeat protein
MAHPAVSWQQVVIGDPLYRPFKHFKNASGDDQVEEDKPFRALRLAHLEWPNDSATRTTKVRGAAARMSSGTLYEAIGQQLLRQNRDQEAAAFFNSAKDTYLVQSDKLRQDLHLIDILRRNGKKQMALNDLQEAIETYDEIQEKRALVAIRNILHPPPPKAKPEAIPDNEGT